MHSIQTRYRRYWDQIEEHDAPVTLYGWEITISNLSTDSEFILHDIVAGT
jgi:hypothetical protein